MMKLKFNFNNFIFCGVCLPQLGSVPAAYAVVAGYSIMASFRYVPYAACVALDGNAATHRLIGHCRHVEDSSVQEFNMICSLYCKLSERSVCL